MWWRHPHCHSAWLASSTLSVSLCCCEWLIPSDEMTRHACTCRDTMNLPHVRRLQMVLCMSETHIRASVRVKEGKQRMPYCYRTVGSVLISLSGTIEPVDGYTGESIRRMASATPDLRLPSQPKSTFTAPWQVFISHPAEGSLSGCYTSRPYTRERLLSTNRDHHKVTSLLPPTLLCHEPKVPNRHVWQQKTQHRAESLDEKEYGNCWEKWLEGPEGKKEEMRQEERKINGWAEVEARTQRDMLPLICWHSSLLL